MAKAVDISDAKLLAMFAVAELTLVSEIEKGLVQFAAAGLALSLPLVCVLSLSLPFRFTFNWDVRDGFQWLELLK